jgi:hypothetical protein
MSDLVLVSKRSVAEVLDESRTGRKARESFAIRTYAAGKSALLVVPSTLVNPDDKAEFYQSESGFAVKLTPDGDRSVSQKKNARTINIAVEIKNKINIPIGTTDLKVEDRGDRMWFFPFSQFSAA